MSLSLLGGILSLPLYVFVVAVAAGTKSRSQVTGHRPLVKNYTPERVLALHYIVLFPVVRSAYIHAFRFLFNNQMSLVQRSVGCTDVVCPVLKLEDL